MTATVAFKMCARTRFENTITPMGTKKVLP
jgi:hypothetical protein